jgi:hypothetical protein
VPEDGLVGLEVADEEEGLGGCDPGLDEVGISVLRSKV